VAMRDVDVNLRTQFITHPASHVTTVQDLQGKRVALGSRASVQAGLLAYYFLHQLGLNPERDLAFCTFYEDRPASTLPGVPDVVACVCSAGIRRWSRESPDA